MNKPLSAMLATISVGFILRLAAIIRRASAIGPAASGKSPS